MLLFLLINLISLSYSDNVLLGTERLSFVGLSLIFPIFFLSIKNNVLIKEYFLIFFSLSTLIHASLVVFFLTYQHIINDLTFIDIYNKYGYLNFENFFGFSGINGMYYSLVLVFSYTHFLFYLKDNKIKNVVKYGLFFLSTTITFLVLLLIDIKMAYAGLLLAIIYFILTLKIKTFFKIFFLSFVALIGVYKTIISPSPRIKRFIEIGDPTRLNNYKSSFDVIWDNLFLGVGLGDELTEIQKVRKDFYIVESKHNAHNEFIEITLGSGVIGLTMFIFFLVNIYLRAFRNKNHLFIIFLFLISGFFMIESVLVRHYGILFTSFFLSYFLLFENKEKEEM
ncbi:O-antigen ligase family protein [Aquimarina muelleri]|uniref:O-antigen ligase family protein n=1 Tax=Aquimarina muelleri TaxID=279356 RepID=UPI0012DD69DE|nr:O-antigen ligase family protein [Aquimarina muelleri]MCX2764189.1 O-antigen ligase family protein [Aquimarina muelleri]